MTDGPPAPTAGLRHVALTVYAFDACLEFYTDLMGMKVEWQPDKNTAFLTSGSDNLALHRSSKPLARNGQRLDHMGFVIDLMEDVDRWHAYARDRGVPILKPPKTHRDGARSFMCRDPDGTTVQIMYHPHLSGL